MVSNQDIVKLPLDDSLTSEGGFSEGIMPLYTNIDCISFHMVFFSEIELKFVILIVMRSGTMLS